MKLTAVAGLLVACVWVGVTHPVLALAALGAFTVIGTAYEFVRAGK